MSAWSAEVLAAHRLTRAEYRVAADALGRELTWPELGVLSVLWSEHCSYKSSRVHLARLPRSGSRVVVGPGENAGAISIDGGWVVVFKIESHNHPSFIEPFHGAATGVGGILRDVFTMGARPVALLNSLRFGDPAHAPTRRRVDGVIDGLGAYGNAFGVPMVGGEIVFHPDYQSNCLVNAVAVGVAREDALVFGRADGPGNAVIYAGARTGRDGIHGATMASAGFNVDPAKQRPRVQIADPFRGKLLLEACMEALATGAVVGMQDMGAAGLTSSSVEMAFRSGTGLDIDLDAVPRREASMDPYAVLLSESQERMLLVVCAGREGEVLSCFERWELDAAVIGRVTEDGVWRCRSSGREVCALPVPLLVDGAPRREDDGRRAAPKRLPIGDVPLGEPGEELLQLFGTLDHASKHWIYERFDTQVGTNTVIGPGADAALLRWKGHDTAIALTVDGNARHVALDPEVGALGVVAEACRNLACVGAEPIGATDGLNFGSSDDPDTMAALASVIDGLARGGRAFDVPFVSGNVSLHNVTLGRSIPPTPMVAVVGRLPVPPPQIRAAFGWAGLEVGVIGALPRHGVGASSWLWWRHRREGGAVPPVDVDAERGVHQLIRSLVLGGTVEVAHDIGDGGFGVAIAECCVGDRATPAVGLIGRLPGEGDIAGRLFGEDHGRVIIAWRAELRSQVMERIGEHPFLEIGVTGGDRLVLDAVLDLPVERLRGVWESAGPRWIAAEGRGDA